MYVKRFDLFFQSVILKCMSSNETRNFFFFSYTCVIENVLKESGLQRDTLWSLNSFT